MFNLIAHDVLSFFPRKMFSQKEVNSKRENLKQELAQTQNMIEFIKIHLKEILEDSSLQESLKAKLVQYNSVEELDSLLKNLFNEDAIDHFQSLIDLLKNVLTIEQISAVVRFKANIDFPLFLKQAQHYSTSIHVSEDEGSLKNSLFNHWKKEWPVLISYILNLINLFVDTLDFMNINKSNISLWDRQLILFIICKFIAIPGLIVQALIPFLGNKPKVYIVAYSAIALLSILTYAYQKWLRPSVEELSNADNMKKLFKGGRFKQRVIKQTRVKQLAHSLMNKHQILIGPPGSGKTGLVEALAQLAAQEEKLKTGCEAILPENIRKRQFFRINCKALASRYNKTDPIQKLKNELEGCSGKTVLFFDEVHALLEDSACFEALKPFLDQKDLICIGATNPEKWEEIKKKYDQDEALSQRWPGLKIESTSDEEAELILLGVYQEKKEQIFKQTGIQLLIEKEAIKEIVKNSKLAFPEQAQPRKAVDCLEELMNRCQLAYSSTYFSPELEQLRDEQQLEIEKQRVYEDMGAPIQIDQQKLAQESIEVQTRKEAARIIQSWRKKELTYKNECAKMGSQEKFNVQQDFQIAYILSQYYVIPQFQQMIEGEISKWKGKMDLKINQDLIDRYFQEKIPKL